VRPVTDGRRFQRRNGRLLEKAIADLDTKSGVVYYTTFGVYYMLGNTEVKREDGGF